MQGYPSHCICLLIVSVIYVELFWWQASFLRKKLVFWCYEQLVYLVMCTEIARLLVAFPIEFLRALHGYTVLFLSYIIFHSVEETFHIA